MDRAKGDFLLHHSLASLICKLEYLLCEHVFTYRCPFQALSIQIPMSSSLESVWGKLLSALYVKSNVACEIKNSAVGIGERLFLLPVT